MPFRMHEILAEAEEKLKKAKIYEAKTDAWLLFEFIFQIDRAHYFLEMTENIADKKHGTELYEKYKEAVSMRSHHIPLQYITGHQMFMGIDFMVNHDVLIPRQDTEILAEKALKACQSIFERKKEVLHVLDMCTGSGCLAVSLKMLSKAPINMTAVDLSKKALKTAAENAKKNCCEIEFVNSDLFEKLGKRKFDIIVSNPPYIKSREIPLLMEEVRNYEPLMALDGEEDGLRFYREITGKSREYLKAAGVLFYEIGYEQAEDVIKILEKNGFENIQVFQDLAGLDRVVMAEYAAKET